jgi:hypothetical protein
MVGADVAVALPLLLVPVPATFSVLPTSLAVAV